MNEYIPVAQFRKDVQAACDWLGCNFKDVWPIAKLGGWGARSCYRAIARSLEVA